jgi:hypothetical protein
MTAPLLNFTGPFVRHPHLTSFNSLTSIDGKIVGVRYYRGYASAGGTFHASGCATKSHKFTENVLCRREPNNQVRATPSGLILSLSCDMAWD